MPGLLTWPETQNRRVPPFFGEPEARVPFASAPQNFRRGGKRFDVIDYGRRSVQPNDSGKGRPDARIAALAFERFHQRRFLAALVRARSGMRDEIEIESAAENILAEVAGLVSFLDGPVHNVQNVAILAAN